VHASVTIETPHARKRAKKQSTPMMKTPNAPAAASFNVRFGPDEKRLIQKATIR